MPSSKTETATKDETTAEIDNRPPLRERIAANLVFLRSAMLSVVAVLGIGAVLVVTVRDLTRAPIVLEEITVPAALREQGYTSLVALNLLWDAIEEIRNYTGDGDKRVRIQTASRQLDVVEPGSGLSLQRLTQMLRALFNLPQTRIAGEFACPVSDEECTAKKMALKVRIYTGKGTHVIHVDAIEDDEIEHYFEKAALRVLAEQIDPLVAAKFYSFAQPEWEKDWQAKARQIATRLSLERDTQGRPGKQAAEAAVELGWIAVDNANFESAIAYADNAIKIEDEMRATQGLWRRVTGWLDTSGVDQPRVDSLLLKAYALTHWSDLASAEEEALRLFEQAKELNDRDPWVLSSWGAALQEMELFEAAAEKYEAATALAPDDPFFWSEWGYALEQLEDFEAAVEKYKTATALAPDEPFFWSGWGYALQQMEEFEAAAEKFEAATALAPKDYDAWVVWADTVMEIIRADYANPCDRNDSPVVEFLTTASELAPWDLLDKMREVEAMCGWK